MAKGGGQYLLKKAKKGLRGLAKEAEEKKATKAAAKVPAEPKTTPKADKPQGKGTKAMREQLAMDEATKRVEEAFKPYEGATPNVPQEVFPRVDVSRQSLDPVIQRAIADPVVRQQMLAAMERGMSLKDWYNMEPTRLLWEDIAGKGIGTQRFNRFQDFMAPTSAQSPVDLNVGNASRWGYYDTTGQLPPETLANPKDVSFETPPPPGYGSKGQVGQFKMAMPLLQSGQPPDPLTHLKTSRYGGALKGNLANAPMDAHATRAPLMLLGDPEGLATSVKLKAGEPTFNAQTRFAEEGGNISDLPVTWWKDVPKNAADYYALEDYYKGLGQELGLPAAQGQATGWVGNAGLTGVKSDPSMTAQDLFNKRVASQALKRDMDPRDLLTQLMTGAGYLGLGGVALGGAGEFLPGRFPDEEEQY